MVYAFVRSYKVIKEIICMRNQTFYIRIFNSACLVLLLGLVTQPFAYANNLLNNLITPHKSIDHERIYTNNIDFGIQHRAKLSKDGKMDSP